jgi:hypothetical protein
MPHRRWFDGNNNDNNDEKRERERKREGDYCTVEKKVFLRPGS